MSAPPARRLLDWFDRRRRPLPWRRDRDPYRVWLSEVMLQQTRVAAAVPYYERFLERFPDLQSLAAAAEDEVLAAWSGLGYYRRARQLHAAARQLAAAGGGWPDSAAAWQRLPGVGPYTAAAIASIAFGERVAALDGNAVRVLTRLAAEPADPRRADVRRRLAERARGLLDAARPGDGNQALMELGATICRPRRPRCDSCPLRPDCRGAAEGQPERYPARRAAPTPRHELRVAAVVRQAGKLLLFRRPRDRRQLAGFWELPWVEGRPGAAAERALGRRYGGRWRLLTALGGARHAITDRRIQAEAWRAERHGSSDVAEGPEAGWFAAAEVGALPVGALERKLLAAACEGGAVRAT